MIFTVYVLRSETSGKSYTGFTGNPEQRLKSHNELGNDWTKSFRPWVVIFTKEFQDKKEAIALERWLKTGVGRAFIKALY